MASKRDSSVIMFWLADSASPDEDSESVCSSLDGQSVVSEEGVGEEGKAEDDVEFYMAGLIDQLGDKK